MRVIETDTGILVLGTQIVIEAAQHLPDDVVGWEGSYPAAYVKRTHGWQSRYEDRKYLPKDAVPGVLFVGLRRAR